MKNTVYALAKTHTFDCPEAFGAILADHFLRFPQVAWSEVSVEEDPWARIPVKGVPHPHSFVRAGSGVRACRVRTEREHGSRAWGGVKALSVIKTTRSGFRGFFRDAYTTLPETADRVFATTIDAEWELGRPPGEVPETFDAARSCILETFAQHDSASVQHTIHAIGEALLACLPQVSSVQITMPNQHRLLANLAPFGMDNENEIFIATSEPFGLIKGTVTRE